MNDHAVSALSPLDGRYAAKLAALRPLMSEQGFMHRRVQVEITWLLALSDSGMPQLPPFSAAAREHLRGLIQRFSSADAWAIKEIEKTTNHDVKAVEYWLKQRFKGHADLEAAGEFVHFACTSEDINNTSHALMLKAAREQVLAGVADVAQLGAPALGAAAVGLDQPAVALLVERAHLDRDRALDTVVDAGHGQATFLADLDPVTLQELPPGEVGEIVTHGPMVFKGYWGHPEATRAAFFELDGKRFFRTGDLGRMDEEGYFFITDRLKRMINASGFKVWPAEVEALMFRHPAIQEACIISTKDAYRGESVKAVVVLRPEHKGLVTAQDIMDWCRENMAVYKIPRAVSFVDALPKSGSGKVMWRALQELETAVLNGDVTPP